MSFKICHFILLLEFAVFFNTVNARSVSLNGIKTVVHLPASQIKIDYLLDTVCIDLGLTLEDYMPKEKCIQNFWSPEKLPTPQTELKVLCRSENVVQIEVRPSDNWQLVVLIPEKEIDDEEINYRLIEPQSRFTKVNIFTSNINYVIFSTILNKDGRPSLWEGKAVIPAWDKASAPEHKKYDVHVQFANYTKVDDVGSITGVLTWNHTGDSDVCFDFTHYCSNGKSNTMNIWPDTGPKVIIEGLALDVDCEVKVTGKYGATQMVYHTPLRKAYDNSTVPTVRPQDTKPEIPHNISIAAVEHGEGWEVHVSWAKPTAPPEYYGVVLRADTINTVNVSGNATEAIFPFVTGAGLFNVSVYAYKGHIRANSFEAAMFPDRTRWAGVASGAWGAAALGALALALCCVTVRTRVYSRRKPQIQESKPLDEDLEALEAEICEDQWEVKSERLVLHEVIGEGAFGVVRRGTLAPAGKEVAVKMLKEFPSLDEVRSFRLESELMKSVGPHPHVVSLVGCCSGKKPLIIAEYCARGDLLSFLRRSWDVMVSKRNAKYNNNNIETCEYRNDLFKWKIETIRREHSRLVVNKMYDMHAICDSDLTSLDLLSFCRQIAMGMEFLATNRLVHRDLAARNVLVTGDRTLKIADFGLSRDVYEENQYKQKGNGKMPVKWMALESLTRRIYTSKSDVWSFGVVVWEVVTVGGSPYPEVPAARLPRLLRAGYRMPRPLNCSKQLYELMQCCWLTNPRERPTFAELHQWLDELLNSACADDYLCLDIDDEPPPTSRAAKYLKFITRGKRAWHRESYERPLKPIHGVSNHYTSPPVTLAKAPA